MGKLFYAWLVKLGELDASRGWCRGGRAFGGGGKEILEMQGFCTTFARLKNHAVT
jgi:hypothetical protein